MLYLILIFIAFPALELYLLIKVGQFIGALNTVLILLAMGGIGIVLARLQGFSIIMKIKEDMEAGVMPTDRLIDGLLVLLGAFFLIAPGFFTDIIGILLILPFTRTLFKPFFKRYLGDRIGKELKAKYEERRFS